MKNWISLLLLISVQTAACRAQSMADKKELAIVSVIDGFNRQDFKSMKTPWSVIGKIVLSSKMIEKQFGPFYTNYGSAQIDTITHFSDYDYVAKLIMSKKPSERIFLKFFFNDNAKIDGMGFAYPPMLYKKSSRTKTIDASSLAHYVDSLLENKYTKSKTYPFNGSIAVIDDGKSIYQKHIGYADYGPKTAINDTTMYELASVSKQFTATAILLLAKEGKLLLQDSIQKFIPDFPYPHISIENLMTHTSGLPDYEMLLNKVWDKSKFATNNDVVDALRKYHPKVYFQPNERFMYSNTGYVILSVIIEKASGMTYAEYLKKAIFEPLEMYYTRVYNTRRWKNEKIDNYAYGYVYSQALKKFIIPDSTKENRMVVYQDPITGDGTVNSCIRDLIIWENALLDHTLIDEKTMDKAFSNYTIKNNKKAGYGYGFVIQDQPNTERLVFHTGGWPGYSCIIMRFVDVKLAVVVLSNNEYDNFTRLADDIAHYIIEEQ